MPYHQTTVLGRTIAHYEIVEKLGEGGMGVVYKARDRHLDRFVALKVLPASKLADPDRKRRFVQEAKAASALNHPNIITIHDIAHEDGVDFMVMEYVPGKTLDKLIPRKGLRFNDTLQYAVQIADALAAAHAAGIVHRDIKPSNIMVTGQGRVKVLDFGLAKLTEVVPPEDPDATRTVKPRTEEGTILGTVSYMSPEQAQGQKVDARSDIFSFGAMLYEMIAGQQAFHAESKMSTLAAIIKGEPKPLSEIAEGTPREIERIVTHCLRKDRSRRFQHIDDVKTLLEEIKEESDSGNLVSAPPPVRRQRLWLAMAAAVLVAGASLALWWTRPRLPVSPWAPRAALSRLTSDSGLTWQPAISPDGKLVAYASDRAREGNLDIWVRQVAGGEPARLTRHLADDYEPVFSPDGSRVAYRSDRDASGVYVVSTLGGEARLIAANGCRPRFSPDGQWLAYWVGSRGSLDLRGVYIGPSTGGPARPIAKDMYAASSPVWSPDGKQILFIGRRSSDPQWDWWVAPVGGGAAVKTGARDSFNAQRLTTSGLVVIEPGQWSPSGDAVFFSAQLGDTTNLWRIAISPETWQISGAPVRLTTGSASEIQPSVAAGGRVVFSSVTRNTDIWSLPIDANAGKAAGELERVTSDAAADQHPSLSAEGNILAFMSNRSGNWDVWTKDLQSGRETQLTLTPAAEQRPVLSPDGGRVAYLRIADQKSSIYWTPVRQGVAQQLCDDCGIPSDWSPDGRAVLFWRVPAAEQVGSVEIKSHNVTELLRHRKYPLWDPRFSPDGRWIVFHSRTGPAQQQVSVAPVRPAAPPPESDWIAITDGSNLDRRPAWSPDGNLIYFTSERDSFRCIWAQRVQPATKPLGAPFPVFHRPQRAPLSV